MRPAEFRNTILHSLSADILDRLDLQPVYLPCETTLETPGEEIHQLVFLESGLASMTTAFRNGQEVEVGMFGWESVIGFSALIGRGRGLNRLYMQMEGTGHTSTREHATVEFERRGIFHDLVLRFVQAQLLQTAQSAGCNARHKLEQRLARWILLCHDRALSDSFHITQEFLAMMLGVARPAVSVIAGELQDAGMIRYHRGTVTVLDRAGLEKQACECYEAVRGYLTHYADEPLRAA